jgi:hypothetical protein
MERSSKSSPGWKPATALQEISHITNSNAITNSAPPIAATPKGPKTSTNRSTITWSATTRRSVVSDRRWITQERFEITRRVKCSNHELVPLLQRESSALFLSQVKLSDSGSLCRPFGRRFDDTKVLGTLPPNRDAPRPGLVGDNFCLM